MLNQIITIFLSILQIWVPACLLYWSVLRPLPVRADRFLESARQGQALGQSLIPDASGLAGQDADGNIILNFEGKTSTVSPQDLFPDSKNTTDPDPSSAFGNDAQIIDRAYSQIEAMKDSTSATGQAYRTVLEAAGKSWGVVSNIIDWDITDNAIAKLLSGDYGDCEIVLTTDPGTTTAHVPDYRTCERVRYPGGTCKCRHDYTVELVGQYGVTLNACTTDGAVAWVDVQHGTVLSCEGGDNCRVTTAPPDIEVCALADEGVIRAVASPPDNTYTSGCYQTPTCENGMVAILYVHNNAGSHAYQCRTSSIVVNVFHIVDRGWTCDPGCEVFLTDVNGDDIVRPKKICTTREVCEYVFVGCDDLGNPIYENQCHDEEVCSSPYSCSMGPCETATSISGAWISENDLYSPNPFAVIPVYNGDYPPGFPLPTSGHISNLAHEVTIQLEDFNQGVMNRGACAGIESNPDCTFLRQECVCAGGQADPATGACPGGECPAVYMIYDCGEGEVRCYRNLGDHPDTCGDLESNPDCVFFRQECIEGAEDPDSGVCYAWTVIYDCGADVGIDDPHTTLSYVCDGVVRCMGEECVNGLFDPNNTGFARAVALLQMIQYAGSDMDCTSNPHAGCFIWTGDAMTCKKALGGWVNCCTEPPGVSLGEYLRLLTTSFSLMSVEWDLTGVLPDVIATNPLNGVWSLLKDYDPWTFMKDTFASAWDSLVGASETAGGVGADIFAETLTQKLMNNAYEIVESISPELAEAIFEVGDITGEVIFSESMTMFMSAVSFIMWIYTIYQILDLLVHIIWQCEQAEFELGAKRQLKVCHYMGSYCASDILGICIEKRESYCCYKSPLARIMQEQIRNQIDHWGSAKSPNCAGLTASELAAVNWDLVDLSEWLALLNIAGKYPTQREVTLEGLTGSGSQFNFNNSTDPRPNTAQRTLDRINESGEDLEQLRIEGGMRLWGMGGGGSREKRGNRKHK